MKKLGKKSQKSAGRPPLAAGLAKTKRLDDVRFAPAELAELKERAEKSGQRWSDWVRQRLGV